MTILNDFQVWWVSGASGLAIELGGSLLTRPLPGSAEWRSRASGRTDHEAKLDTQQESKVVGECQSQSDIGLLFLRILRGLL